MKKLLFICFILWETIIPCRANITLSPFTDPADVKREIRLMGSLENGSIRSLLPDPIEATISNSSLDAIFLNNVGIIDAVIYSESGDIIYTITVDTQSQESLSIDVSDCDSGLYEIRFVGSTGQYMYGTFEIE